LAKVRKGKKWRKGKKSKKGKGRKGSKRGAALLKPMNVDDALAAVIGSKKASRPQCIKGLWTYIKKHKLQDPINGRLFTPDQKMAKIFGHKKMNGFRMAKYLNKHIS
jgi:chromatin remodeling complex protein RSC6